MAVPKDKVLSSLKEKLKGKNPSKTYLEKTATRFAAKIENEADIDEFIDDRLEDLVDAISEADRRVTLATKKAGVDDPEKDKNKKPVVPAVEDDDEDDLPGASATEKAIMKKLSALSGEIAGIKSEKTKESLTERFLKDERLKGISPTLLKKWVPTKEEDYESAVETTAEDLKDFVVIEDEDEAPLVPAKPALGTKVIAGKPPVVGKKAGETPPKDNKKVASADEINSIMPNLMPNFKPATTK